MKKTITLLFICFAKIAVSQTTTTTTTTVTTITKTVTTSSTYQEDVRPEGSELSIGLETGLAVGDLRHFSSLGVGGTVKYAYNFNSAIAGTFQTGYIDFISKNVEFGNGYNYSYGKINTSQIPFKAGIRYSIGRFYVEPQLGVSILRQRFVDEGYSNSTSAFTYAGNIGVLATRNFEMSVRYEGLSKNGSSIGYLGLRLAYVLPLPKKGK